MSNFLVVFLINLFIPEIIFNFSGYLRMNKWKYDEWKKILTEENNDREAVFHPRLRPSLLLSSDLSVFRPFIGQLAFIFFLFDKCVSSKKPQHTSSSSTKVMKQFQSPKSNWNRLRCDKQNTFTPSSVF